MDKAQRLIQSTSSALQTAVGKPYFAAAGLTTESVQPLAAAVFEKTTELVKVGIEEVLPSTCLNNTATSQIRLELYMEANLNPADAFPYRLANTPPTTHTWPPR